MAYTFEFDMAQERGTSPNRVYKSDATAKRAAMMVFRGLALDPDDELLVFDGNTTSWHIESRYVGKVAYRHDGETIDWFPNADTARPESGN